MHIDTIPNRNSRPAYLLRESYREKGRVRKRTLANLSSLPLEQIEAIRRILKGERMGPVEDGLEVVRSRAHGHVEAAGLRQADRRQGLARAQPRRRHGGAAHPGAGGEQARHDAGVGRHHAARGAGHRRRR
jgi:hypothetical protein